MEKRRLGFRQCSGQNMKGKKVMTSIQFILTTLLLQKPFSVLSQKLQRCDPSAFSPQVHVTYYIGGNGTVQEKVYEGQDDRYTLVIPANVTSASLTCLFRSPVKWGHLRSPLPNLVTQVSKSRTFSTPQDFGYLINGSEANPTSCYIAQLIFPSIVEEIVAIYKCKDAGDVDNYVDFQLFSGPRNHEFPGFLVRRGQTVRIFKYFGKRDRRIGLGPDCGATHPGVGVSFFYSTTKMLFNNGSVGNETGLIWKKIDDASISFNPLLTTIARSFPGFAGYTSFLLKCQTNVSGDVVIFQYKEQDFRGEPFPVKKSGLYVVSTSAKQEFDCQAVFDIRINLTSEINEVSYDTSHSTSGSGNSLKYHAKTRLAYLGSESPSRKIGQVDCLNTSNNATLQSWRHQLYHDVDLRLGSIGLTLDGKARLATCLSTSPADIEYVYTTCSTIEECIMKRKCLSERDLNCPDTALLTLLPLNPTTLTFLLPPRSGRLHCIGVDVDAGLTFFLNTGGSLTMADEVSNSEDRDFFSHHVHLFILDLNLSSVRCYGMYPLSPKAYFAEFNVAISRKLTITQEDRGLSTTNLIIIIVSSVVAATFLIMGWAYLLYWRRQREMRNSHYLSPKCIEDFLQGNLNIKGDNGYENAQRMPFTGTRYQLDMGSLILLEDMIGSGAYGVVLRGVLTGLKKGEEMHVAVKMVKPDAELEYLKALLCELKVIAYVGGHHYIAELIGAVTAGLAKNKLYVVLKFYENGSLKDFLVNHRKGFKNLVKGGKLCLDEIQPKQEEEKLYENHFEGGPFHVSSLNLLQWSWEISQGMEFLAHKKIIHGDLATRNVLLDENLVTKISDFGLARQLYEYTQYVKTSKAPLPFRWLSLEALTDMRFSIQSDVWAYGVTIWEIFSLGEVPYAGLNWTDGFLDMLKGGYRLNRPHLATDECYDVMVHSWASEPDDRPDFHDISAILAPTSPHDYANLGKGSCTKDFINSVLPHENLLLRNEYST